MAATSPHTPGRWAAVTTDAADRTLIEHWNGKAWKVQPSPNPGGSADGNDFRTWPPSRRRTRGRRAPMSTAPHSGPGRALERPEVDVAPSRGPRNPLCGMRAERIGGANHGGYLRDDLLVSPALAASWLASAWALGLRCSHGGTAQGPWSSVGAATPRRCRRAPDPAVAGQLRPASPGMAATSSRQHIGGRRLLQRTEDPGSRALVERWNGKAWEVDRDPNPPPRPTATTSPMSPPPPPATPGRRQLPAGPSRSPRDRTMERREVKDPGPVQPPAGASFSAWPPSTAGDTWAAGCYNNGTEQPGT